MPADESTAEVSHLLEQWDAINRSPLQLKDILAADSHPSMASADGSTHLVAVLARLISSLYLQLAFNDCVMWHDIKCVLAMPSIPSHNSEL